MTAQQSALTRLLDWAAGEIAAIRLSHKNMNTGEFDDQEIREEVKQVEADIAALSAAGPIVVLANALEISPNQLRRDLGAGSIEVLADTCPKCGGSGRIPVVDFGVEGGGTDSVPCPVCKPDDTPSHGGDFVGTGGPLPGEPGNPNPSFEQIDANTPHRDALYIRCDHCDGEGDEPHTDNDVTGPAACRVCHGERYRPCSPTPSRDALEALDQVEEAMLSATNHVQDSIDGVVEGVLSSCTIDPLMSAHGRVDEIRRALTERVGYIGTLNWLVHRQWKWVERMGWHNKTALEYIALIGSEVGEATNECRGEVPSERLGEELADIVLRVGDMAVHYGIDLEGEIDRKMAVNEQRGTRGRAK